MSASGSERGSVSLEAAIALPVFICVVVAIGFTLRLVQVHERVQHAISQAALEVAGVGYVYGMTGLLDTQREVEAAADKAADKATDAVRKATQFENWLPEDVSADADEMLENTASALTDRLNGVLFSQFARLVTGKYLSPGAVDAASGGGSGGDAATGRPGALDGVNVVGGESGLDFIESTFLTDGSEEVDVRVSYRFHIPIFLPQFSDIEISQRAVARAWLFSDGEYGGGPDEAIFEDDIWSQDNFTRGRRIRELFHANLPDTFPGLSAYDNGVATLIKSLDTTADSYQTPYGVGKKIGEYVRAVRDYAGQAKPFGKEGIVIPPGDITTRRLVLVIPRNDITPEVSAEIDRCIRDALAQGVILQVERYAKKQVAEPED